MSETKSITETLQEFSKKLELFSHGDNIRKNAGDSDSANLKKLQDEINRQEEEKSRLLRAQFQEYLMPVTQDIEENEENLVKAYNLFCQVKELNEKAGDRKTHLKSLLITSPLCSKSEYTSEGSNHFAFLQLWFLLKTPEAAFVPEIISDTNATYSLEFIDIELWQPSILQKEIMQAYENY